MEEQFHFDISFKQLVAVGAIVGGLISVPLGINAVNPHVRADPFTGAEGRQLRSQLAACETRITRLEAESARTLEHVLDREVEAENWKRRIVLNESHIEVNEEHIEELRRMITK